VPSYSGQLVQAALGLYDLKMKLPWTFKTLATTLQIPCHIPEYSRLTL